MNGDVLALVVGTILSVGAIAFVLYPLFFGASPEPAARPPVPSAGGDSAIRALREIEFDRATGKLSDADYAELRRTYGARALQEMRDGAAPASDDPIEARVRAYRASRRECATCGIRPEPDAVYCSGCGAFLERACPACQAPVSEQSAGFCGACGEPLVARSQPAG